MSDTSSIVSFEEVSDPHVFNGFHTTEERNVERLRAMVSRSAENGSSARKLSDGESPDVCYVLQYKGLGGKLIDSELSCFYAPALSYTFYMKTSPYFELSSY